MQPSEAPQGQRARGANASCPFAGRRWASTLNVIINSKLSNASTMHIVVVIILIDKVVVVAAADS